MSGPGHQARHITVSRRVATYDGGPNRRARLYVYKTSDGKTCEALLWRGWGGGCSPGPLFSHGRVVAGEGQFFSGIAADEITRVVLVSARGVRHTVPLSRDHGFIYDCRAYNGCSCVVAWLDAYVGDHRAVHQDWIGGHSCSHKRRR